MNMQKLQDVLEACRGTYDLQAAGFMAKLADMEETNDLTFELSLLETDPDRSEFDPCAWIHITVVRGEVHKIMASDMMVYYFETDMGSGLRKLHVDPEKAKAQLRKEVGTTSTIFQLHKATKEELDWVEAMGGYTPC